MNKYVHVYVGERNPLFLFRKLLEEILLQENYDKNYILDTTCREIFHFICHNTKFSGEEYIKIEKLYYYFKSMRNTMRVVLYNEEDYKSAFN